MMINLLKTFLVGVKVIGGVMLLVSLILAPVYLAIEYHPLFILITVVEFILCIGMVWRMTEIY